MTRILRDDTTRRRRSLGVLLLAILISLPISASEVRTGAPHAAVPRGYEALPQSGWWFAIPRGSSAPSDRLVEMITDRLATMRVRLRRSGSSLEPLIIRTPNRAEFRRVTVELGGGDPEGWVAALAFPAQATVVLDASRLLAMPLGRGEVIAHELGHVVLGEAGPNVPRWYHEGMAQWLAGERIEGEWLRLLAFLATDEGIYPFDDLDRFLVESQRETSVLYAQSHHFVLYMNERFGEAVHVMLLDRLAAGDNFDVAFRTATGVDFREIETEWTELLARQHRWWSFVASGLTFFQGLAVVLVIAYFVERSRRRRVLARMAADEGDDPTDSTDLTDSFLEEPQP